MADIDLILKGKKIVILIGRFGRGGSERQAYLLARQMREHHRLDTEVWALTETSDYADDFESAGIPTKALEFRFPGCPVSAVRGLYWLTRLREVVFQLKHARVGVLLPFTTWPNVVAGLTYRLAGIRACIWGERSAGIEQMPPPGRLAVRQYRQFVANSTAGVDFLADQMNVARKRIAFVPNGVEETQSDHVNDWPRRLGLEYGQLLVVKVANLTIYKDHATLLRAWKLVQDAWQGELRPMLALAGNFGDKYEECLRIVQEAGLHSTVRFLGAVSDIPTLLNAADLTAFSSPKEGMPNGVLECMAAGKAVVASDLPGIRDALGPGCDDCLVPAGHADGFAQALLSLLWSNEKRSAIGAANRARIRAEFSVQRMTERYLGVVRGCLA
jgi:glycosyltransferase involved in cell wall biosynthesis